MVGRSGRSIRSGERLVRLQESPGGLVLTAPEEHVLRSIPRHESHRARPALAQLGQQEPRKASLDNCGGGGRFRSSFGSAGILQGQRVCRWLLLERFISDAARAHNIHARFLLDDERRREFRPGNGMLTPSSDRNRSQCDGWLNQPTDCLITPPSKKHRINHTGAARRSESRTALHGTALPAGFP